jgi:hypothetical protein
MNNKFFVLTKAQRKAFEKAKENLRKGKTLSLEEFRKKLKIEK